MPVPVNDLPANLVPQNDLPDFGTEPTSTLKEVGGRMGATLYGAGTGIAGAPGELEKFAAYTVPEMLGTRQKGERDQLAGRETLFPTVSEVQKGLGKVGINPPAEQYKGFQTAGEVLGPMATALPGVSRGLLGVPSQTSAAAAKQAEKLGFKLRPAQVRQDEPVGAVGALGYRQENQSLANKLASKTTGKEAAEIDDKFIRGRLNELGKDFDRVYQGQQFNIDQPAVQALQQISQFEQLLPPSTSLANVRKTVDNILGNYQQLIQVPGSRPQTFSIQGDALQTIRNDLMSAARSASDRSDAHRIYELIDTIDDSIARNHPQVAAELNRIRPLYRNTVVLEDLMRSGGITQGNISLERLGNLLGARKEGVRRMGGELDELGRLGRDLRIRSRAESTGKSPSEGQKTMQDVIGSTMGSLTAPLLQTRLARGVQRRMTPGGQPSRFLPPGIPATSIAGTAVKQFQGEKQ